MSSWAQQGWETPGWSQHSGNAHRGHVPVGVNVSSRQNGDKKADQGSLEDLSKEKGVDEPDRAQQRSPQPSEPVSIQRRSPLIRNRKTGSMEVTMQWAPLVVLRKVLCLGLVPGIPFNMPEFDLILGKDLQKLQRDFLEGRPPTLLLLLTEEGQEEHRSEGLMRKSK